MFPRIPAIRKEERRVVWSAFGLLFVLMAGHGLLDTARDALFLSSIPATRLPIVSLLIAAGAVGVLGFQRLVNIRMRRGRSVAIYLALGAVGTAGLWRALPWMGETGLYVLYVWSTLLVTLIVVEFWLSMGRVMTPQQAKRLYAFVGTGSVAGATFGYAVAGGIASMLGPRALLPAAAATLAAASVWAWKQRVSAPEAGPNPVDGKPSKPLWKLAYVRKLALLVFLGTLSLTLANYLFKASIAESVPADELGPWFAAINLVLNVTALLVQLAVTSRVVRLLGVTRSGTVLPAALSIGALGVTLGFGLPAALILKGADGTLRHTLSRTVRELLYVPLPERIRSRAKRVIDVVAQRGGQAVASATILGLIALGLGTQVLGALLVVLTVLWAASALMLRGPYLAVFRRTLLQLATEPELEFPELDLASIESLVGALNHQDDLVVLAALEILEREGKSKLVPALLLHHPSTEVVTAALSVLTRANRSDFIPVADSLQGNANPTVHAAVVRAKSAVQPDVEYLRNMFVSPCRATRTTAAVYLHSLADSTADESTNRLAVLRNHDNRIVAELAIARAAPHADTPLVREILRELIESTHPPVAEAAIAAMAEIKSDPFLDSLVPKLAVRALRANVAAVLPAWGSGGLEHLKRVLQDEAEPDALRREVPEVLGRFAPVDAVPILLRALGDANGMIRYRTITTLERMLQATPGLAESPVGWGPNSSGRELLDRELEATLTRIYEFIDQRRVLMRGAPQDANRQTGAHEFLVRLLRDKQRHAEERLVRLIGLKHPSEDFGGIWRGLRAQQSRVRSSSQELLEHLVAPRLRLAIGALFGDSTDAERLTVGLAHYEPGPATYNALLTRFAGGESATLSALAIAQIGELGLSELRPTLVRMPAPRDEALREVLRRTLGRLEGLQTVGATP